MRVTTDFWASALIRRVFGEGGFAAVMRRGATEAGAAFVIVRDRLGLVTLYGPAAQAVYDPGRPEERRFTELLTGVEQDAVDARLAKESRFDSDIWVIEVEPGATGIADLLSLTKP